jgi:ribonuclease BN (tRNA processing enzyme)
MKLKITCLGVGNGTSYILRGDPSSSFLISKNGMPYLLVDCGLGVGLQYKKHIGESLPQYLYISHNHIDHAGELPVLLLDYYKKGKKTTVTGHSEVIEMLKNHRLQELSYVGINLNVIADWRIADSENKIDLGYGVVLELKQSKHSYPCYGFRLKMNGKAVIGYGGDSGYDKDLYDFVNESDIVILDGREKGNEEHASVEEIKNYNKRGSKDIYIIHHDSVAETKLGENVIYWKAGDEIMLEDEF